MSDLKLLELTYEHLMSPHQMVVFLDRFGITKFDAEKYGIDNFKNANVVYFKMLDSVKIFKDDFKLFDFPVVTVEKFNNTINGFNNSHTDFFKYTDFMQSDFELPEPTKYDLYKVKLYELNVNQLYKNQTIRNFDEITLSNFDDDKYSIFDVYRNDIVYFRYENYIKILKNRYSGELKVLTIEEFNEYIKSITEKINNTKKETKMKETIDERMRVSFPGLEKLFNDLVEARENEKKELDTNEYEDEDDVIGYTELFEYIEDMQYDFKMNSDGDNMEVKVVVETGKLSINVTIDGEYMEAVSFLIEIRNKNCENKVGIALNQLKALDFSDYYID